MILVILVVLVSVVYPSRVAASIAIPDVNRSWTLPDIQGNSIQLTLPFLVPYTEHASVSGFLLSYFRSHEDVSHGAFSTGQIDTQYSSVARVDGPEDPEQQPLVCAWLQARVWLAPFDFGIMQQVEIQFCPAVDMAGFLEISVRLIRETGEGNAWRRANKIFLNHIRKQLLVWRSMALSARKEYEAVLSKGDLDI
jgi:hypothetical protein